MQPSNQPVNIRKFLLSVLLVVILLAAGSFVYNLRFHLVSTDPPLKAFPVMAPYIDANFNKTLAKKGHIIGSSADIVRTYEVNGKQLRIFLKSPLEINKEYTLTLENITSERGKIIKQQKLTFTALDLPFSSLSSDQQKYILDHQDKNQGVRDDPITSHLPHSTLDYNLTSEVDKDNAGNDILVLNAEILLAESDLGPGQDQTVQAYKQEVVDYIKSLGLDPANYTIRYTIVTP